MGEQLRVVIALHHGEIVGVVAHSVDEIDGLGEVQYIHALGVRPDYQRRLIGTILKQNVLDYAHHTGIEQVVSTVHRRNHPMLGLNEQLNAVVDADPDDGDYLLTITASQPLLAGFSDDANHYGETGPVTATHRLFDAINDEDFVGVWEMLDENMQLCRAQAWLWNNRDRCRELGWGTHEELLPQLLDGPSSGQLWNDFAQTELVQLAREWLEWLELSDSGSLGATSRTRIAGPGYEHVVLLDASDGPGVFTEPTMVHAVKLTVHHGPNGWRIASYNDEIPTPGWPPLFFTENG